MDIDVFPQRELPHVFRALRTALSPATPLEDRELAFLRTYARIAKYPLVAGDPATIMPHEVDVHGPHQKKRLVQLCALAVLLSHPVKPEAVAYLRRLSRQLFVDDPVVDVVEALQQRKYLRVRLLAMRRAMRALLKEAYRTEGSCGVLRFLGAMFLGASADKDKVLKYRRLGLLPEGTLGREYWKHLTEYGFGFPGEPGGIPDSVAYHDVAHVLAGHDSSPFGEIQQGGFQGGNRREDGFFFIQFVILHFHHGVKVTPAAPPAYGNFDPEKVLWAIHRGASCKVDLTHQWDFWPFMALPLARARTELKLLPMI